MEPAPQSLRPAHRYYVAAVVTLIVGQFWSGLWWHNGLLRFFFR